MAFEYLAAEPPAPEVWLALDEGERLSVVEDAHARGRWPVGENARVHAAMHVIVENRLASGEAPVVAAYERLRAVGVDRHQTVHALASVVTKQLFDLVAEQRVQRPEDDDAFAELDPDDWRAPPPLDAHVARPYTGRRPAKKRRR